jgi:hypothetical protein
MAGRGQVRKGTILRERMRSMVACVFQFRPERKRTHMNGAGKRTRTKNIILYSLM